MLFLFGLSIVEMQSCAPSRLAAQVSELLRAHRLGHHIVVVPRNASAWISQSLMLDEQTRAICNRLGQEYTQVASLVPQASVYTRVVLDRSTYASASPIEIVVEVREFESPYILDRLALIVEDAETDGVLISCLAEYFSKRRKHPHTNFEIIHAGGERFCDVVEAKIADRRIILAILDSDRHSPYGAASRKHNAAFELLAVSPWPLLQIYSFEAREAENLIPLSILAELDCAQEKASTLRWLSSISLIEERDFAEDDPSFLSYFDYKLGTSPRRFDLLANPADRDWIVRKVGLVGHDPSFCEYEGFGARVVPSLLGNERVLNSFLNEAVGDKWMKQFGAALLKVLWFAVAPPRLYC